MSLNKQKHVRYWRMCANILPSAYQTNDASRMSLGFFILSALDLLGILHDHGTEKAIITPDERQAWTEWIYECQLPDGMGFRGFPGTDLADRRSPSNQQWDPGNLPNTFFALAALVVLGDGLERVKKSALLQWLPRLQRDDGSFGELLGQDGTVEGGRDLRYCCCAAGVAFILMNLSEPTRPEAPFDVNRLIDYILGCHSFDGGFGESPLREPHSGLNYCAVATLDLLRRLRIPASSRAIEALQECKTSNVRWLLDRQTMYIEEGGDESQASDEEDENYTAAQGQASKHNSQPWCPDVVGFNGRSNKMADTCYCFWNSGTLAVLDSMHLANTLGVRNYLLNSVQHLIGGFGKDTVSPPDIMHSYLGLATLSLYGEAGIERLDAALCMSTRAVATIRNAAQGQHTDTNIS